MAVTPRTLVAGISAFSKEAVRRKVWITAGAYVAISIGVIEISKAVAEALLFPDWTARLVTFLLILGFPLVVVLAWIFDIGDRGLEKTPSAAELAPRGNETPRSVAEVASPKRSTRPRLRMPEARTATLPRAAASEPDDDDVPPDPERVKRAALGHVRHELRTPINAILGYSEMLLEDDPSGGTADDLARIRDSGRQLLELVDSILDAGRIEADGDRDIESYAAQIEADLRTPVTSVIGYCEMLVEAEMEAGRPAMTPDLERIADAARTLLATSSDILRVAEGAVDMSRAADSSAMTSGVLAKLRPVSGEVEGEGSLLVVDDNPTNRDLLTRQLARHGYMVATAADGAEALDKLQRQTFDLVLLDVIMPNVDGVETLKRIKADERMRETSVIMLSSLDEVDSAVRCLQLGAEEYLAKPVESSLLEARIRANLEIRRLRTRERLLHQRVAEDDALIDRFLTRGIPISMADQVRRGSEAIVEARPAAAVLCARLDQTSFGAGGLDEFVAFLGDAFARFDEAASSFGAVDARLAEHRGLVAASFDGDAEGQTDAGALVRLAQAFLADLAAEGADAASLFRCGIHVGPLTASLFGSPRPRFDLWGDAVETARAVAELAEPGTTLITPPVKSLLADAAGLETVGVREVGDRGTMRLHRISVP